MTSIEEFESMLKEVVSAKRLSASKMEKLTEVSIQLMENDTQLVSVLYRTHKSLRASSKISSLYVFDAICRAARSQVVKRNLTGDINSEKGNCTTFLLKIDSVLDGLFQDILSSGIPEAKEKTKKILDIWTKSNTFPANVLARLGTLGRVDNSSESNSKETKQAASDTSTSTSDPRKQPTPPTLITPPPAASSSTPTAEAAQAALLALLTSAAGANNPSNAQIPVNTANIPVALPPQAQPQAQLEQLQLALLQQLSKANNVGPAPGVVGVPLQVQTAPYSANLANSVPPFPSQSNVPTTNPNVAGPSSAPPLTSAPYAYPGNGSRDPRYDRYNSASNSNGQSEGYTDDRHHGGDTHGYRGGFRGRERGDFRSTTERHRDAAMRERANSTYYESGPPARRRFESRSQSPPPRRRDHRSPYSPPGQDALQSPVERTRPPMPGAFEPGKDEFGRDIRAGSEESQDDRRKQSGTLTHAREGTLIPDVSKEAATDRGRPIDSPMSDFDVPGAQTSNAVGLETFDISSFDPTGTDSWKALGDAFQVTHGYMPSQEELMQLVMAPLQMMMGMSMGVGMGTNIGDDTNATIRTAVSDANFGHMGDEAGSAGWSEDVHNKPSSDRNSTGIALERNAEDTSPGNAMTNIADTDSPPTSANDAGISGGQGGRMHKVGDSWKFIRDGV